MMRRREVLTGGLSLGLLAAAPEDEHELIVSDYGLAFVRAWIGERPLLALVDTGGARAVQIARGLAEALNLKLAESAETTRRNDGTRKPVAYGQVDSFRTLGRRFAPQAVSVAGDDIESVAGRVGVPFEAILGWRFLAEQGFALDYAARKASLGPAAAGAATPLVPDARGAVVETALDGRPTRLLLDTGAPRSGLDGSGPDAMHSLDLGGRTLGVSFRLRDLGAMREGLGVAGVIGHDVLSRFRFGYDPAIRVFRFDGA